MLAVPHAEVEQDGDVACPDGVGGEHEHEDEGRPQEGDDEVDVDEQEVEGLASVAFEEPGGRPRCDHSRSIPTGYGSASEGEAWRRGPSRLSLNSELVCSSQLQALGGKTGNLLLWSGSKRRVRHEIEMVKRCARLTTFEVEIDTARIRRPIYPVRGVACSKNGEKKRKKNGSRIRQTCCRPQGDADEDAGAGRRATWTFDGQYHLSVQVPAQSRRIRP